jgi:uncharacterized membrane protein YedE/YeeE
MKKRAQIVVTAAWATSLLGSIWFGLGWVLNQTVPWGLWKCGLSMILAGNFIVIANRLVWGPVLAHVASKSEPKFKL